MPGPNAATAQYGSYHVTATPPAPPAATINNSTLPFTGTNLEVVLLLAVVLVATGIKLTHR